MYPCLAGDCGTAGKPGGDWRPPRGGVLACRLLIADRTGAGVSLLRTVREMCSRDRMATRGRGKVKDYLIFALVFCVIGMLVVLGMEGLLMVLWTLPVFCAFVVCALMDRCRMDAVQCQTNMEVDQLAMCIIWRLEEDVFVRWKDVSWFLPTDVCSYCTRPSLHLCTVPWVLSLAHPRFSLPIHHVGFPLPSPP